MVVGKICNHARQTPEKAAVIYGDHRLSYQYFSCAIAAARRHLAALGVSDRGVAVLAIAVLPDAWIVGLALRSLGLTTVAVRSTDQVAELGLPNIQWVVTSDTERWAGLEALCGSAGWRHISFPRAAYAQIPAKDALDTLDPPESEGAHILLTSGTTGHYKKVLMDPDRLAIRASFYRSIHQISSESVINVFNCGNWTAVGYTYPSITWVFGGTVVIQERDVFESLQRGGVTHAYCPPAMMAHGFLVSRHRPRRDDAMRLFLMGGPLSQGLADEIKETVTRQVFTYIGSTEASAFTQTLIEQPDDLRWHRILPSREVQIVDAEDRILPAGQEGLLRVRTIDGLNGYLHDDETSRAFFRDGYFYSGDLGVIGPDGRLALMGRVTDVINVLGSKFPTVPIEEAVQREFGVSGACVFSMPQANGEEVVHIALESRRRVDVDLDRMVALLGSRLPGPFRIAVYLVDALPRNDMGKVQRNVLRQQLQQLAGAADR